MREYAFYKGEKLLYIGTAQEIAEKHGVKRNTIYFYGSPTYQKRRKNPERGIQIVRLEDDGNE